MIGLLAILLLLQRPGEPDLVDLARANGGSIERSESACFFDRDVAGMLRDAPFVFVGTVLAAESRLTSDRTNVFTDYLFGQVRVLHRPEPDARALDGTAMPPPPFTPSASAQPSSQTEVRVHVRAPGGHLEIEGVSITSRVNDFPALRPGQRLVIFALYNPYRAAWQVHLTGVFEVAPGGLRPLSKDPDTGEFETVDALGQAIAKASAGGLVR